MGSALISVSTGAMTVLDGRIERFRARRSDFLFGFSNSFFCLSTAVISSVLLTVCIAKEVRASLCSGGGVGGCREKRGLLSSVIPLTHERPFARSITFSIFLLRRLTGDDTVSDRTHVSSSTIIAMSAVETAALRHLLSVLKISGTSGESFYVFIGR